MTRSFKQLFLGLGLTAAVSTFALADHGGVKEDLEHYFPIRTALAGDKTEGVKEHADALAKSKDEAVAKAATALAEAKDIAAARKAFGDVSKSLIATLEAAQKKGTAVGTVHIFECPMAKPYGKWLQADEKIGNPYYGSKMLKCGTKVATVGGEGKGKQGGHDGHGDHDGHGGH